MSRDQFPNDNDRFERADMPSPLDTGMNSVRPRCASRDDAGSETNPLSSTDRHERSDSKDSERTYYLRDRTYVLHESEFATLVEIGRFRVVQSEDLAQFAYGGETERMARDLRRLERQGLVARKPMAQEPKRSERLVVLTKKAKRLLLNSGRLHQGQTIYHGLAKPRELKHDAALYRLYQRESNRIVQAGGRPLRVALDYELKRNLQRELAGLGNTAQTREVREEVAARHGLVLIGDRIQIPDLRLEYETADHERKYVDLELATRNYRPRALAQKAKAGFSIYAPREDASKLRRILDESELTAKDLRPMKIDALYISALQAFGYTEDEARFLYLVATHSGYFVARHFLGFTGIQWGKRTYLFWKKLQSNKHARTGSLPRHRAVYHLFAREIYRELHREHLRNRRRHEREYIEARIAILDFVLANPELSYLETEPDKLAFFCREQGIEERFLPSKTYLGRHTAQPTVRHFVDRFPMFLLQSSQALRVVTFSFIQGSAANLSAFVHHLQVYSSLFRELREFRFLYLARTEAHFAKARELFHALVTVPLESNPAEDLLRYFKIRKAWDLHQYGAVTEADLAFRNVSTDRFSGERFEHFYRAWKAERIGEAHIRATFQGHHLPHETHFETRVLKPFAASSEAEEEAR